jgi:hypothetical protein
MNKAIILLLAVLVSLPAFTQPRKYKKSMGRAIEMLNESSTPDAYMASAETFEGIAAQYGEFWIPSYYAAYSLTIGTFQNGELVMKEANLKRAKESLDKASALQPDESEIQTLSALYLLAMMSLDPEINGPMYYENFNFTLQKAKDLNPENPRPYYMDGLLKGNMPDFMGGGPAAARPLHQMAADKFRSFQNDDPFWPSWGEDLNQEQLDALE